MVISSPDGGSCVCESGKVFNEETKICENESEDLCHYRCDENSLWVPMDCGIILKGYDNFRNFYYQQCGRYPSI